jgi:transcription antitermination protein NusB
VNARRQSREIALQVLFQLEFAPEQDLGAAVNNFRAAFSAPEDVWQYALEVLRGVQLAKAAIDKQIQAHAAHWRLGRMALVDLNLLRIATYEMRHAPDTVPAPVAINEAIELAKKYGSSDSGKFVNGILDQIHKAS